MPPPSSSAEELRQPERRCRRRSRRQRTSTLRHEPRWRANTASYVLRPKSATLATTGSHRHTTFVAHPPLSRRSPREAIELHSWVRSTTSEARWSPEWPTRRRSERRRDPALGAGVWSGECGRLIPTGSPRSGGGTTFTRDRRYSRLRNRKLAPRVRYGRCTNSRPLGLRTSSEG